MKAFYTDTFTFPLPERHFFPLAKYRMLRACLEAATLPGLELLIPEAATTAELSLVHTADYLDRVKRGALTKAELQQIGFPWSSELIQRSRRSVGATIAAALAALDEGIGVNLAGGTHHAFADAGEGYCIFNDVAVAIRVLQTAGRIRRAAIVDCDAHQGNGTAVIFSGDPDVFTFSMHSASGFPRQKERSDLDIALADGTADEIYLEQLSVGLHAVVTHRPEMIFYIAGSDPYEHDRLGKLKLSMDGLALRDRAVFSTCQLDAIPLAICMGGGYARDIRDTAAIHCQTVRIAHEFWQTGKVGTI